MAQARQVLYITQYLFDLDEGVELMYFASGGTGGATLMTTIVDESGAIIQSFPDEAGYVQVNYPQGQFPIYETDEGAKLVLSHQLNMEAHVYGLPGHLPAGIAPLGEIVAVGGEIRVFPNPASSEINVELNGIELAEDLVFRLYDQSGHLVLERRVLANRMTVPRGPLAAGRYVYTITQHTQCRNSGSVVFE